MLKRDAKHNRSKNVNNTHVLYVRVEENTSPRSISVETDAAATSLVSTEGYVWRFVILTVHDLTVPALTRTWAAYVKRLNIQQPAKT